MRMLFAALTSPYPPTNGQRIRNWSLLRALAAEGRRVNLVCFADGPAEAAADSALREVCDSVAWVVAGSRGAPAAGYLGRLRALPSSLPFGAWRMRSPEMRAALAGELRQRAFDAVICDDIYMLANIPPAGGVPVLLNKHDITHVILRRYLAHERNPLKRLYGEFESRKLHRWETRACASVDGVMACSRLDRELLAASTRRPIAVVPNVIDTAEYPPAPDDDGRSIVFAGAMDWYPNADAARFLAFRILPLVRKRVPEARFVIAGRAPEASLRKRLAGVAELTGWVPDIRDVIRRAALCVVPLRIGSGTRLKIVEAAAMQKCVVSTSIGAEGLDFVNGQEIVLADTPEAFADSIVELLADGARRRAIGAAARKRAVASHGLEALRSAVREIPALCGQLDSAPAVPVAGGREEENAIRTAAIEA